MNSEGRLTEIDKEEAEIVRLFHFKGTEGTPAGHIVYIKFNDIIRQVRLAYDDDKEQI